MESDHCIWNSTIYRHLSAPSCWRLLKRRKCKRLKYYRFFLRNKLRLFKLLAAMEKENFDLHLLFPTLLSATFSSWNLAKKSLGSYAVFSFCAFARRSIILDFKNWQTYNASSAIFCYVKCVRFFHSFSRRLRRLNFAPLKVCLWRHLASLALSIRWRRLMFAPLEVFHSRHVMNVSWSLRSGEWPQGSLWFATTGLASLFSIFLAIAS